jgi:hypothetical protein
MASQLASEQRMELKFQQLLQAMRSPPSDAVESLIPSDPIESDMTSILGKHLAAAANSPAHQSAIKKQDTKSTPDSKTSHPMTDAETHHNP